MSADLFDGDLAVSLCHILFGEDSGELRSSLASETSRLHPDLQKLAKKLSYRKYIPTI